tara:strand:+ start:89 stop:349 length:261 start_codon:yes stop_codon:yes gene_type:complete
MATGVEVGNNRGDHFPQKIRNILQKYGAGIHIGNVRDNNEDSLVCDEQKDLWIVADGMGGHGFGEVASAISAYEITRHVRRGHGVN